MRDVIETISSRSGRLKVEIVRRSDGHLQVFLLRWVEEIAPDYGKVAEFWEDQSRMTTLAGDLETARAIGREFLASDEPEFQE